MTEFRRDRFESGLLYVGDSMARERDYLDNRLITPSRDYLYVSVALPEYGPVDLTILTHQSSAPAGLREEWAGVVQVPSGVLVLAEILDDDSRREVWREDSDTVVSITVYADRPKYPTKVVLAVGPATTAEVGELETSSSLRIAALTTARPVLVEVARSFEWAGLEILDAESAEVPNADGSPFVATARGLRVAVCSEWDPPPGGEYPAIVRVRVCEGPADLPVTYQQSIALPSGRVTIGDANEFETLDVGWDFCLLQVAVAPGTDPDDVVVWIQPG